MASPPIVEDSDIAAHRAKTRIAVAVVLLAIALGGLALLSRHKPEQPAEESAQTEKQESISSGTGTSQSQINSAQQEPPPLPPPAPETPTEPAATEPPPPPPPAPVVSKLPPEMSHPVAPPTPRSVTAEKPQKAEKPAPLAPQQAQQEQTPAKSDQHPAAEKPSIPPPAKAEPKSYEVQVGVFTDMENAKQLQAKLAEHGIPSHTETKLQIGPFATKAEADAAQSKLKALGMGAVIVPGK